LGAHRQANGQCKQPRAEGLPAFEALPLPPSLLERVDALFARAERESALLQRAWPERAQASCERWLAAIGRGEAAPLTFCYRSPPVLTELRAALERVTEALGSAPLADALSAGRERGPSIAELYAARAAELELEAALAEQIGRPGFAVLARRRHALGSTPEWSEAGRLARQWARAAHTPSNAAAEPRFVSDDARAAHSLLRLLGEQIGRLKLPVRVVPVPELASRAATGDGIIYVRAGMQLTAREGLRVARHEVFAHALPRVRARVQALGLWRVGSAGAGADEEGRAILLEQRFGDLDPERRRELGLRHLTALAVLDGADAHDCTRLLAGFGCAPGQAVWLYARCARGAAAAGGGLCRELEYLPAWLRVSRALQTDPTLEAWLAGGRLSLAAARALRARALPSSAGA
jgi:hypothetical protein